MKSHDASLQALATFPSSDFPTERRSALERAEKERRSALGRAVSCGAMFALCAVFSLFYGAVSAFFWTTSMAALVGSLFSIFSGVTFVGAVVLAVRFHEELARAPKVPAKLRREADAESSIASAMLEVNLKAHDWNAAAREARVNAVSGPIVRGLLAQRAAIERRRLEVITGLSRFGAAVAAPGETRAAPR